MADFVVVINVKGFYPQATFLTFKSLIWGNHFKIRDMNKLRNQSHGLLEKTLIEFKQKGNTSLEDVREYLLQKYQLSVSKSVLKRRIESIAI